MLGASSGVVVASAMVPAAQAVGLLQPGETPRAVGRPMPRGVELPARPPRPKRADSVGFAVVGLGGYGLRQMLPRFEETRRAHVAGLVSGNPDKLAQVGEAYGVPRASRYSYETFDRLVADDRVDAVYITLPSGLHATFAERAFAAGKHVLCEKPMALSSAECLRMIAAAQRADRRLMIGYRCHFEPHNRKAMELMADGAVGDLRVLRTEQARRAGADTPATNWRHNRALAGGGPLEDLGIYGLQAALYLSGETPSRISAATFRPANDPRFSEIFASVTSQWLFPSGATAQLSTSYDAAGNNFAEARGTTAALIMDPATSYSGHSLVLEGSERQVFTPGDGATQFANELDHFADAIRDKTAIRTPGEMGLRDLRIMEAIYASAAGGRTVALNADGTMRG